MLDLATLRAIADHCDQMVKHYTSADAMIAQNKALEAASLPPLHTPSTIQWNRDQARKYAAEAKCLRELIARIEKAIGNYRLSPGDYDLDGKQPVVLTLHLHLSLGDIRAEQHSARQAAA